MYPVFQSRPLFPMEYHVWLLSSPFSISRPSFFPESFWCHCNHFMCLPCCLASSILYQITKEVPTRFFLLSSSILSIYNNQQSLPDYLGDVFCSHWDFCLLPHLLKNLDSHQNPSSLSSAIACLNLFQSSPSFHCTFECTSHILVDTLLVYDCLSWKCSLMWQSQKVHYLN